MEGRHPKRRKDKYNPYRIWELDGHYYISFKDGQGALHEFEISEQIFYAFDTFELEGLSYLNVWDRHIEQSEIWEPTLSRRVFRKPEDFEKTILERLQMEKLHSAIRQLPEKQRTRLLMHYYDGLTYAEIAKKESCSIRAAEYSVHGAIRRLRKILEKI